MAKRARAERLNAQRRARQDQGRLAEAIALYQQAAAADPKWSIPLYNLGLVFKNQCKWEESLMYNQLAASADAKNEAAWWNLGIAATALGRWDVARSAWRGFGIKLPDGEGPVDLPCGYGPIRLDPDGNAEVVWAFRLDPARAMLASIPFPESKHHWKDIVLNDGAPVGYRTDQGQQVPVFNALQLLERSAFGTYVAQVAMPHKRDYVARLAETAANLEGCAEDWSTSVRMLCKACSEGRPHDLHDTEATPLEGAHLIGIAARDRDHATRILAAWESGLDDVQVESLDDAADPDTP